MRGAGRTDDHHRACAPSGAVGDADAPGGRMLGVLAFDTEVRLYAYPSDGERADDRAVRARLDGALDACRARCLRFERIFSRTRADSDISRAHGAAPAPVAVAPETAELVRLALGYCERSGGLFDITMGTVTSLWDFHAGMVPGSWRLAQALPHVGWRRVRVGEGPDGAPTLAIDDPETVLDLGGVAKGYIADDLARTMEAHGVTRFALNLGGNVLVRGGRPAGCGRAGAEAGSPWRIGIADPRDPARLRAVVGLESGSVVTSGLHERRFTRGGVTYHHILDPADGMPARTDVASATIVAARSLDCDGYSTTALMLGARRALEFVEALPGIEAVIVDEAGRVSCTSGIAGSVTELPGAGRA